jgi:hypothetical protein
VLGRRATKGERGGRKRTDGGWRERRQVDKKERMLMCGSHGELLVWSMRYKGSRVRENPLCTRSENLDHHAKYSLLGYANGVRRVRPA